MFDLPPGAERTVQYADFLGPRTSFLLVTIPSEVSRGVVARSVADMSGYYCSGCNAIKPLFDSVQGRPSGLAIPCLGTVPFDPELARHGDRGIPFAELPDTPAGRAVDHVARQLLDSLDKAASAQAPRELRPGKEPSR
jgi:hypothetical protein